MTSDGVDGTAENVRAGAEMCNRPPGQLVIKRGDGRLAPRYIEPAYSHTPAGGDTPHHPRRERQVALALRNSTNLMIVNLICGAAGPAGRLAPETRLRLPPPRCPAKRSR
jgi:hypothetical protein